MGRGKRVRKNNYCKKRPQHWKKANNEDDDKRGQDFIASTVNAGNFKMEAYYAAQGLHHESFASEGERKTNTTFEEWNEERLKWRKCLGEGLPASFRFCQCNQVISNAMKEEMHQQLKQFLKQAKEWKPPVAEDASAEPKDGADDDKTKTRASGRKYAPIVYEPLEDKDLQLTDIPFCPHGYQMAVDRVLIRKHPALKPLHQWLVERTECGHVTRQETVSMIPPIVLLNHQQQSTTTDSTPTKGDVILDMCAAPGSKTSQLLEGLASNVTEVDATNSNTGLLVANDVNPSRAHMLTHQLKRILHHFPVALVTAAPAQTFPSSTGPGGRLFDKILADVPCSGDGTSRKNIHVWKTWSLVGAHALHKLQLDIAWKGVATLLKTGGYMCYSTCSLNPVEDEAVVSELLRKSEGNLELVDIAHLLGDFKTRPGISTWKVMSEPGSRREMRNRDNKRNAKMQQRRKEYEENQAAKDDSKSDEAAPAEEENKSELPSSEPAESQNADGDVEMADEPMVGNEVEEDVKRSTGQIFEPTSMDDDYLMNLATESAGLAYFKTMSDVPPELTGRIRPSVFPPSPEEATKFHLQRCIRVLAHDNNTGGFFVALLKKVGPIGAQDRRDVKRERLAKEAAEAGEEAGGEEWADEPDAKRARIDEGVAATDADEEEEISPDDNGDASGGGNPGERGKRNPKFDLAFVPLSDDLLDPLIKYYGLGGPGFRKDVFMARAGSENKTICYIAPAIKDLFDHKMDIQKRVNVIATGLKAFVRNSTLRDGEITHRLAQEAAHFLVPFMSDKRKFSVSLTDFEVCLGIVSAAPGSEAATATPQEKEKEEGTESAEKKGKSKNSNPMNMMKIDRFSPEFAARARALEEGGFIVVLEGFEERHDEKMVLVMWRCRGDHVNTLVAAVELESFRSKLLVLKKGLNDDGKAGSQGLL